MQRSRIVLQECHGVNFKLNQVQNFTVLSSAWRSNIPPTEWLGRAIRHYYRWQQLGDGQFVEPHGDGDEAPAVVAALSEMELFASVAEHAPEALGGMWARLHKFIREDDQFWVYPVMTVCAVEDGFEPSLPSVNRAALARAWPALLQHAQQ